MIGGTPGGDERPDLTFLTPTLDPTAASLTKTLDAIDEARRSGLRAEHVVIDGGSSDEIRELVSKRPRTRLIDAPGANISDSLSTGWSAATGRYVMVMNAGDVPTTGLSGALETLDRGGAGVGVFAVLDEQGSITRPRWRGSVLRSTWIHAGMIARGDLLESCGGYDRRYQFAMDWEWLSRAERQGVAIEFLGNEEPVVLMEPFGLSRQRALSSAGEFLDVARRDIASRWTRLLVLGRHLPSWFVAFVR